MKLLICHSTVWVFSRAEFVRLSHVHDQNKRQIEANQHYNQDRNDTHTYISDRGGANTGVTRNSSKQLEIIY